MSLMFRLAFVATLVAVSSCSPANKVGEAKADKTYNKKVDAKAEFERLEPKVDILFVVDNSRSMQKHQTNMAVNIGKFLDSFVRTSKADFHMGVTTTDTETTWSECCGRLVGKPAFLNRTTPNLEIELGSRIQAVGVDGIGYERMFDPVYAAFSEPNLSSVNKSFLRADAHLALIFITDAEDQSVTTSAQTLKDFLRKLKGPRQLVLSYGAIVPSNVSNCPRDEFTTPLQLEYFLSLSPSAGSNVFSLCDAQFGEKLADLGRDLVARIGSYFPLARTPQVETIEVTFGSQKIPSDKRVGWTFDAERNAVRLGPDLVLSKQPQGTEVRVKYIAIE